MKKELQLVTFEQAKRLKALGFNYMVTEGYNTFSETLQNPSPYCRDFNSGVFTVQGHEVISAPTVALALKWIRDEKKIDCGVVFFDVVSLAYQGKYQLPNLLKIGDKIFKPRTSYYTLEGHETYEAAESALLDELLTILEKKNER
jgi:hypothetical protein